MANPFENKPNADALAEQAQKYAEQAVSEALEANNYAVIKQAFKTAKDVRKSQGDRDDNHDNFRLKPSISMSDAMRTILNAVKQKLYESHGVDISAPIAQDKHNHDLSPVLDQELANQKMADLKNQGLIDKIKNEYSSVNFRNLIDAEIMKAYDAGVVKSLDVNTFFDYIREVKQVELHIEDYD
jgi:hypothetical protein